jgi:hypothetical protein
MSPVRAWSTRPALTTVYAVQLWQCVMWGLFGGAAVEGLEWSAVMRRGRWPWNKRLRVGPVVTAVVIRLGIGGGLAGAIGAGGSMNQLGALSIGIAAPLIIEKIAQQVPNLEGSGSPLPAPASANGVSPSAQPDGQARVTGSGDPGAI